MHCVDPSKADERQEAEVFRQYLEQARGVYFRARVYFCVWDALTDTINRNKIGPEEAEANLKVWQQYKNFFPAVKDSLMTACLLELAKMFDSSGQSLSLMKLVNYSESNRNRIVLPRVDNPEGDAQPREDLTVEKKDIDDVRHKLKDIETIWEKIREHRDKYLAHEDVTRRKVTITLGEIKRIMKVTERVLNIFSLKTARSTHSYQLLRSDCTRDARSIIESLRKYEPYRVKELSKGMGLDGSDEK